MTPPDLSRIRSGYEHVIRELRGRMDDDRIVDILERYRHGGLDRDQVMDALDVEYIGTLYELVSIYQIPPAPDDPGEELRQAEMLRLLFAGEEVPKELRQPASWRVRH